MPPAGQRKVEASSGVSGPPDEGETEPIAEDSLFSPSPVSCADILPRWGEEQNRAEDSGLLRIRRTISCIQTFLPPGGDKPPPLRRSLRSARRGDLYGRPPQAFPAHGEGAPVLTLGRMRSLVSPKGLPPRQRAALSS